ncbi:MAG TPA: four-carbon acid sugar kinase family protein [Verrucomicrobiae bacterium]|nr:four-carbon acid sugar kinase family protein [Verrucomicrobiae bacterium]
MTPAADLDCLVIADDLTGACDAGAPFVTRGLRTVVPLSADAAAGDCRAIAVSTDSRDLEPSEIREAMRDVSRRVAGRSARIMFTKIDSTLRGSPGCQIAAAMEEFGCRAAVVCPAFPAMRRIVRNGFLAVEESPEFAPVRLALRISSVHVTLGELAWAIEHGARIVSLDADCDDDLDRIAAAAFVLEGPILWAGSSGLAAAVARAMGGARVPSTRPSGTGPVLFCIGSDHPVTLAQQKTLVESRTVVRGALSKANLDIPAALARGEHVLLCIDHDLGGEAVRRRIGAAAPAAMLLSGGDTAALVCRALGVEAIELCDELLPGIPLGSLRGGDFNGVPVVTKSGGFGTSDTLIRIADYFSCPNS